MRRIESQGSYWYLAEDWYVRTPKAEAPREAGPWREPEPGDPLYDLERHPMLDWLIVPMFPERSWLDAMLTVAENDTERDIYERSYARAVRYDPDWFPLLCILVNEDGMMASAPKAYER